MYFKKLELVGFKSFMDKTTLHFEPGVTAVVGPNGCGKSNIFDSIRWVLGEQSVKALRGCQMEDVIFNGTDSKESVGMAEVSVTFTNEAKFFPVDNDEVEIRRRIFRSGESEYLLNKAQVRLKDITDLLAGTGIGAESYSLVEQGKIDLVLSSRPEDRRLVFDEAAGITRYKSQKKEALRKLEDTEQNLLRVGDIINEVKRQIGSLERQAAKARRYKEVFEELKTKEINFACRKTNEFIKEKDVIIANLRTLETKEAEFLGFIKQQEQEINSGNEELKRLEDGIMSIRNQILNSENLVIRNNQHMNFNKERIAELESNRNNSEIQLKQTEGKIIQNEEKLNNARQEYDNIKKGIDQKNILLKEKQAHLDALNLSTKTALESITAFKNELLDLLTKITRVKNQIQDLVSEEQIQLARKKRLEVERAKVNEERAVYEDNLTGITRELEELAKNFEGLNLKISGLKKESEENGLSLLQISRQLEELERERLTLESHKEFLNKLKTKYEDISESMNALIYLDKMPNERVSGLVVKINDYQQEQNPSSGAPLEIKLKGEAKPIDLDTQRIDEKIRQTEEKIGTLRQMKADKEAAITGLTNAIQSTQDSLHEQEINLANKKSAQQSVTEQFNKVLNESEVISMELADVQQELSASEERSTSLKIELSQLDNTQKQIEEAIKNHENNIFANNSLREAALVEIAKIKTELEGLVKRLVSDEATFKMLEDAYNQDKENLLNIREQIKETYSRQESLATEIKDFEEKILQIENDLAQQKDALTQAKAQAQGRSQSIEDIIKKIDADKKELDTLKDSLYDLQMQNKDVDFKIVSLRERIAQSYKMDLDAMAAAAVVTLTEEECGVLAQEIEKLKEKLDNYGTVNLVAIEEYDELKKRYDFLTQQQNDLNSAKESLHEAILKLNRDTKKMFLETFEKIQVEFRNYFKLLFSGGDAQVFLIDEHDPLESGIEIICRPPGKKLQNVLLLSGGEKSMSAIALIFAIFKIKPSPFCILDEIDAALDEANVDRFGRMLGEFIKNSQFIIITHNKKTIANANVMYGITMEGSGVSKIVSVKFAQNNKVSRDKDKELVAGPV